jgi:murein DD-endopeptidase MepM/ murein hydrolase activator NlpD
VQTLPAAPVQTVQAAPTFALPADGILTSTFGDGRNHQGIDIAGPIGSPIRAASAGDVIDAGPAQGFGLWVRLKHADGTITTYGHNNENVVKVGDVVTTGQQIATVGNRGDSTGPHLHFEVKLPSGSNTDPLAWLNERGIDVKRNEPTPDESTPEEATESGTPPSESDTAPAEPAVPPAPIVTVSPDTLA